MCGQVSTFIENPPSVQSFMLPSFPGRFSEDNEWYRAKVEKIEKGGNASILYVDYGNREVSLSPNFPALDPQVP